MKQTIKDIQRHLLSGVSFMMPIVVAGGVILAISLFGAKQTETGLVPINELFVFFNTLGKAGMAMMVPIFSGYIAYSICGKPGLATGVILGYLANNPIVIGGSEIKSGFLGALILGLLSGYFIKWMKTWPITKKQTFRSIMPILIIPTISVLVIGVFYYLVIALPISWFVNWLASTMIHLQGGSKVIFAIVMGIFSELDFGGAVTKTVSMFTLGFINEGIFEPNGIFRVLVSVPPIGIFLASFIAKEKFNQADRESARAIGIIGALGITEGAIPFAIKYPKAVYPASILGCIAGALIAAFSNVTCPVPHGGFIVLPVVGNKLWFVIAICVGSLVSALVLKLLMKDVETEK